MIHDSAVFFGRDRVRIAPTARIDAFCLLSAGADGIDIGDFVHLGAGCMIFGGGGKVELQEFSGLSPRVCLFTASDDFSGNVLINATLPEEFRAVTKGPITLQKHASIGCGSVVLPGVTLGWGATVGALSLVRQDVPECNIWAGIPARSIGQRNRMDLENVEEEFLYRLHGSPRHQ